MNMTSSMTMTTTMSAIVALTMTTMTTIVILTVMMLTMICFFIWISRWTKNNCWKVKWSTRIRTDELKCTCRRDTCIIKDLWYSVTLVTMTSSTTYILGWRECGTERVEQDVPMRRQTAADGSHCCSWNSFQITSAFEKISRRKIKVALTTD